ncbi:MAG: acetylglutamate kinase [Muribaculaceae bacterium]|nr:acetylglutamate kinase [Muribaculaceae bacterium]
MAEQLTIIKVSGKILENPEALKVFIRQLGKIQGRKIIIHSAAQLAKTIAGKMGHNINELEGRPVIDDNALQDYTMVYAGLVNKHLVTMLQARKYNAVGLTGADMNIITSAKKSGGALGATGYIKQVNAPILSILIDNGITPVIAPFSHDGKGQLLFNETDAMAAETAKALAVRYDVTLIYCFTRNGVLLNVQDPDSVVPMLRRTQYKAMREMEIIKDWFANKVDNAFSAIDHGVKEVIITSAEGLGQPKQGTHIK